MQILATTIILLMAAGGVLANLLPPHLLKPVVVLVAIGGYATLRWGIGVFKVQSDVNLLGKAALLMLFMLVVTAFFPLAGHSTGTLTLTDYLGLALLFVVLVGGYIFVRRTQGPSFDESSIDWFPVIIPVLTALTTQDILERGATGPFPIGSVILSAGVTILALTIAHKQLSGKTTLA